MSSEKNPQDAKSKKKKLVVRTRTPRPDELSRECFEFITGVDDYKRRNMRSFLTDEEILQILFSLGYDLAGQTSPTPSQLEAFAAARKKYRHEQGRLFPTWSEIYDLLAGLGYRRSERGDTGTAEAA